MLASSKKPGAKSAKNPLTSKTPGKVNRTKGAAGDNAAILKSALMGLDFKSRGNQGDQQQQWPDGPLNRTTKKTEQQIPKLKPKTPNPSPKMTFDKALLSDFIQKKEREPSANVKDDNLLNKKPFNSRKLNKIHSDSTADSKHQREIAIADLKKDEKKRKTTNTKSGQTPSMKQKAAAAEGDTKIPPVENEEQPEPKVEGLPKPPPALKKNVSPTKSYPSTRYRDIPKILKEKSEFLDLLAKNRSDPIKSMTSEEIKKKTLFKPSLLPKNILDVQSINETIQRKKKELEENSKHISSLKSPREKMMPKLENFRKETKKEPAKLKGNKNAKKKVSISTLSLSSESLSSSWSEDED